MYLAFYNGEHSITFGSKNSWTDWHLVPSSRPVFAPPKTKTNYVDIPGMNGSLDLSEAVSGRPVYENRQGSFDFYADVRYKDKSSWIELYSEIMAYLHGQRMEAYLDDEPYYRYVGRFDVDSWTSGDGNAITINYDVYPYKMEPYWSDEDWLWDPFDFEKGVIRNFKSLTVKGSLTVSIPKTQDWSAPTITVKSTDGSGMDVSYNGKSYHLNDGVNRNPNLMVKNSDATFTFTGNGTISMRMRGGVL